MDFAATIIAWYTRNKRDLPWRNTRDPYKIWLSEVILQQTRVQQGLSYYHKFIEKYPAINDLASAGEEEVLRLWQGLGYYSRARNLLKTASEINSRQAFPASYEEILSLKGIGPYTAAAISSFAYNLPHPVIDGNVYRVLSRYFGVELAIDSSAGKKYFSELAHELLPADNAAEYNQAIMEFGALQCVPVNPDCGNCTLKDSCSALSRNLVQLLPVKEKKTVVQKKWFYYIVIRYKNNYYIRKRTEDSIWKNLYDFPLIESGKAIADKKIMAEATVKYSLKNAAFTTFAKTYKHQLSHRSITAKFLIVNLPAGNQVLKNLLPVKWEQKPAQAIPRLIDLFLDDLFRK